MVPMLHESGVSQSPLPGHSHTHRSDGSSPQEREDQTLAPTFLTDEGAPRPLPINPYSTTTQPAAVSIAPRPPNGPARAVNMHARGRRSQRSSSRLDPSDGCCRRKEHRKKVRLIRPGLSEAEQGAQRNYGELPYVGVQSLPSHLLLPHTGECARSGTPGLSLIAFARWLPFC
jgi:hypothetical protein